MSQNPDRDGHGPVHGSLHVCTNAHSPESKLQADLLQRHHSGISSRAEQDHPKLTLQQTYLKRIGFQSPRSTHEKSPHLQPNDLHSIQTQRPDEEHFDYADDDLCKTREWLRVQPRAIERSGINRISMVKDEEKSVGLDLCVDKTQKAEMVGTASGYNSHLQGLNMGPSGSIDNSTTSTATTNTQEHSNGAFPTQIYNAQHSKVGGALVENVRDATTRTHAHHTPQFITTTKLLPGRIPGSVKGNKQLRWGLGCGSNDISGWENVSSNPIISQDSQNLQVLPIYAPKIKRVTVQEIQDMFLICPHEDSVVVLGWLSSTELHTSALRGVPKSHRKRWSQRVSTKDLEGLLEAGIISPAVGPSRAHVRLAFVEETAKQRRRVLFEPRDLNLGIKASGVPKCAVKLPSLADIRRLACDHSKIEYVDFTSFYYQIELSEKIRPFYRLVLNDELYELCVLPQGGTHSVGVAQALAITAAKIALSKTPELKSLVYIDNIFVGRHTEPENGFAFEAQPFIVGTHGMGTKVSVLGTVVDTKMKTMDAGPSSKKLANKLKEELLSRDITFRQVLQIFGVCGFISRALHVPWCTFPLSILSKTCILFAEDPMRLNSKRGLVEHEVNALIQMLETILSKEPCSVMESDPELVIATDASDWGWGAVILGKDEEFIECGEWNEAEKKLSINTRELEAIFRGLTSAKSRYGEMSSVGIFTDSVALFALKKGHSMANALNQRLKTIFGTNLGLHIRWLESEKNPADGPSRGYGDHPDVAGKSISLSTDQFLPEDRLWFDGKWSVQAQAL